MIIGLGTISLETQGILEKPPSLGHTNICQNIHFSPSGSLFIQMISAARSGAKTAIHTQIGTDLLGEYILQIFRREGIGQNLLIRDEHYKTLLSIALINGVESTEFKTKSDFYYNPSSFSEHSFNYRTTLLLQAENHAHHFAPLITQAKNANARLIYCVRNNDSIQNDISALCDVLIEEKRGASVITYNYQDKASKLMIGLTPEQRKNPMINKIGFDVFCGSIASALQSGLNAQESCDHAAHMISRIKDASNTYDAIPYIED